MAKQLIKNPVTEISNSILDNFKRIKKTFSLNLDNVLGKSLNRAISTAFSLDPSKKVKKNIVMQKVKALKNVMLGDIDNIENETTQSVSRTIASGYAQGTPSGKIRAQMLDSTGQIDWKVDRAIRTNIAWLSSLTKLKTWHEMGFTKYAWVLGKNDARTRIQHKRFHGNIYNIRDGLEGRAPIPGHVVDKSGKVNLSQSINCRCGVRLIK